MWTKRFCLAGCWFRFDILLLIDGAFISFGAFEEMHFRRHSAIRTGPFLSCVQNPCLHSSICFYVVFDVTHFSNGSFQTRIFASWLFFCSTHCKLCKPCKYCVFAIQSEFNCYLQRLHFSGLLCRCQFLHWNSMYAGSLFITFKVT